MILGWGAVFKKGNKGGEEEGIEKWNREDDWRRNRGNGEASKECKKFRGREREERNV